MKMLTSIKNMHRKVVVRSMTEHMIALRLFSSVAPAIPESQRSLIDFPFETSHCFSPFCSMGNWGSKGDFSQQVSGQT